MAQPYSSQHTFLLNHNDKINEHISPSKDPFVQEKIIAFDNDRYHNSHLGIQENVSSLSFLGPITGGVKLARRDPNQPHNYIIYVRASSPYAKTLDYVYIRNDTSTVYIHSVDPLEPAQLNSTVSTPFLTIDIILFVKPHTVQFGRGTSISTTYLPISIHPDLWFETYHMTLSSTYGLITGIESLEFTAHAIRITTSSSSIVGNWSLPRSMTFTSKSGDIDVNLVPKRWSSGPSTGSYIHAETRRGDIAIRMPLEKDKLSLRNGTALISAPGGSISGTFVHGAITTLKSGYDITAKLLPYWAFYEWAGIQHNYITTQSGYGSTTVEVLPPQIHTYYGVNPLFFANSCHVQNGGGTMKLTYPGEWGGRAVGRARHGGTVDVRGEDFEEIERNGTTVEIQRRPLGSKLLFETNMAVARLHLKPCSSPFCRISRIHMDEFPEK
ncbi:hypothetical protein GQ43DRAFT_464540 [Delitschia confertaspora ATCC 74209]|uniref:Uncharacterized protein n=1 Tax=Delitschia confertaspora ATCC 74209 TaxID=1513339 RepID=A0A9P4JNM5_9PLEO|nr:hypothetical protein GQ43DRAFT_464540 [Delitschia confertaspora ATCC 74209]